jgi:DNA mismatch repair protein MutS2
VAIERIDQRERESKREREPAPAALAAGDVVAVGTLNGRVGQVLELRGNEAVVAVGALKLTVPSSTLTRSAGQPVTPELPVAIRGDLPEAHAATEIDLRGMRVEEMERTLMHALDSAVRADLKSLRIIHGKGTGALRDRVAEVLRGDPRVREYRLGAWNEGGAGVTVAELA